MLFEVFRGPQRLMHTDHKEAIPPLDQLRSMAQAGYTFKKNDKPYTPPPQRGGKKKEA